MARRVITQHLYDSLMTAYREKPGNHSNAAKVAGCERRMARRAFENGWPRMPWAVPIKQVLEREKVEARAARQQDRTAEFELMAQAQKAAQQDAVEARAQEGRLVKMARGASMVLLQQCLRAMKVTGPLVDQLEAEVRSGEHLDVAGITKTMDRIAHMTSQAVALSKEAMRMERLHMGEPEQIVGMQLESTSTQELVDELRAIEGVLRAASHHPPVMIDAVEVIDATPA